MASIRPISKVQDNLSQKAILNAYLRDIFKIKDFDETVTYPKNSRIVRFDEATNTYKIFAAKQNLPAMAFDAKYWQETSLDKAIDEMGIEARLERADLHHSMTLSGFVNSMSPLTLDDNGLSVKGAAMIRGFSVNIDAVTPISAPPKSGTRDDLVFIEAWLEKKSKGSLVPKKNNSDNVATPQTAEDVIDRDEIVMMYRLRVQTDVDFKTFNIDGFTYQSPVLDTGSDYTMSETLLTTVPLHASTPNAVRTFRRYDAKVKDAGLYVSSVDTYNTYDGKVYAIPVARIVRRNDGEFSTINLGGTSVSYTPFTATFTSQRFQVNATTVVQEGDIDVLTVAAMSDADFAKVRLLDRISGGSSGVVFESFDFIVEGKQVVGGEKRLRVRATKSGQLFANYGSNTLRIFPSLSGHPDIKLEDKYKNVAEIIDLRHLVTTGHYDFSSLLKSNFEQFMRGELTGTRIKNTVTSESVGLRKVPAGYTPRPSVVEATNGAQRLLLTNLVAEQYTLANNPTVPTIGKLVWDSNQQAFVPKVIGKLDAFQSYFKAALYGAKKVLVMVDFRVPKMDVNEYTSPLSIRLGKGTNAMSFVETKAIEHGPKSGNWDTRYVLVDTSDASFNDTLMFKINMIERQFDGYDVAFRNLRAYALADADAAKVDVDPDWSGAKLIAKYPFVDSCHYVIENKAPITRKWAVGGLSATGADVVASTSLRTPFIPVTLDESYNTSIVSSEWKLELHFYDAAYTFISKLTPVSADDVKIFNVPPNTAFVRFAIAHASNRTVTLADLATTKFVFANSKYHYPNVIVPLQSRYFTTPASAQQLTTPRIYEAMNNYQRRTWSESRVSEAVTDIISPAIALRNDLSHVTITQATANVWSINDTIKITTPSGIVSGVVDADTAIATIIETMSSATSTLTMKVSDVTGFAVNDIVMIASPDMKTFNAAPTITLTAVDSINKTITATRSDSLPFSVTAGSFLFETTAASSVPTVVAAGIAGTWTDLGKNEATFRITTAPTTNTTDIKITYSVNYPSSQGLSQSPLNVGRVTVSGQEYKMTGSKAPTVVASFNSAIASTETIEVPHVVRTGNQAALPTSATLNTFGALQTNLTVLNSSTSGAPYLTKTTTVVGELALVSIRFDVVRAFEDYFGASYFFDCATLAEKLAKLKANVKDMTIAGKAYAFSALTISRWNKTGAVWETILNSASMITKADNQDAFSIAMADLTGAQFDAYVGTDGIFQILFADTAAKAGVESTVNVKYPTVAFRLNNMTNVNNVDVALPLNVTSMLVDDPRNFKMYENNMPSFKSGLWAFDPSTVVLDENEVSIASVDTNPRVNTITRPVVPGSRYILSGRLGAGITVNLTQKDSLGVTVTDTSVLDTSDPIVIDVKDSTSYLLINYRVAPNTASNYSNVMLSRVPHDVTTPPTFAPFSKQIKRRRFLDFTNKISFSEVENPHKAYINETAAAASGTTPTLASIVSEMSQQDYGQLATTNGVLKKSAAALNNWAQQVFEFDLSHLGMSNREIQQMLANFKVNWTGYGTGNSAGTKAYGVNVKIMLVTGSWSAALSTNTVSTPTALPTVVSTTPHQYVTTDQKIVVMVESRFSSSAANISEVYTESVSLELAFKTQVDTVKHNILRIQKGSKQVALEYPRFDYRSGNEDNVEVVYSYRNAIQVGDVFLNDVTFLAESDGFFVTDLSSSVGHKQGPHRFPNPLTRVGKDNTATYGEFGFGQIPFAADTVGANVNRRVARLGKDRRYVSPQYSIPVLRKPLVGIAYYLVAQEDELFMVVYSQFSSTGKLTVDQGAEFGDFMVVPLNKRPLLRVDKGIAQSPAVVAETEWRTPVGEAQGYMNEKGELIATYQ